MFGPPQRLSSGQESRANDEHRTRCVNPAVSLRATRTEERRFSRRSQSRIHSGRPKWATEPSPQDETPPWNRYGSPHNLQPTQPDIHSHSISELAPSRFVQAKKTGSPGKYPEASSQTEGNSPVMIKRNCYLSMAVSSAAFGAIMPARVVCR